MNAFSKSRRLFYSFDFIFMLLKQKSKVVRGNFIQDLYASVFALKLCKNTQYKSLFRVFFKKQSRHAKLTFGTLVFSAVMHTDLHCICTCTEYIKVESTQLRHEIWIRFFWEVVTFLKHNAQGFLGDLKYIEIFCRCISLLFPLLGSGLLKFFWFL